jgi:transposase
MHYAGIDVALRESAVCIMDGDGRVVREARLPSDPAAIAGFLEERGVQFGRIGLEAGCTAAWLLAGLQARGLPAVCLEPRHAAAALRAGFRNKTDRNDARGIADLVRVNKFRPVWVKSAEAQRHGMVLTARGALHQQLVALEGTIRGLLRQSGVHLPAGRAGFERHVREAAGDDAAIRAAVLPLLEARAVVQRQRAVLDREIVRLARADRVCRLLATVPGVGAHVALAFRVAVDEPGRFARSRTVGAHLGLTPSQYSSGETDRRGRISRMGDREVRRLLYVAASRLLGRNTGLWCPLKAWAVRLLKAKGLRKARVALARKLAVVLHRIWVTGQPFRWRAAEAPAAAA